MTDSTTIEFEIDRADVLEAFSDEELRKLRDDIDSYLEVWGDTPETTVPDTTDSERGGDQ